MHAEAEVVMLVENLKSLNLMAQMSKGPANAGETEHCISKRADHLIHLIQVF